MIGLAKFIEGHREAIEYDLLTLTGHELNDVGCSLSWRALHSFITNENMESALARDLNPDYTEWTVRLKTNAILADIYDVLNTINSNLVASASHKRATKPKSYPRPNDKEKANVQTFGEGALEPDDLEQWFNQKRIARNG